jgi:hypothetical protein
MKHPILSLPNYLSRPQKSAVRAGLSLIEKLWRICNSQFRDTMPRRLRIEVKIPPQTFFNFCAAHVPLLRALMEQEGEASESDVRRLIRGISTASEELPETTWRRLTELQILLPVEPGGDFYFMAEQVSRLLSYLFDEANAASPEIISGYIKSIDTLDKQLSRAIDSEDLLGARLALEELQQTLRRIQSDLDETHRCILTEVSRYKIERGVSVRDKFRRIVYWMERYVDPIVEMVRVDGPLRATFDETERLLQWARERGLYNDLPGLERNFRQLRTIQRHALRIFQQCRRELQPLYESLRRASFIAEGAAVALERMQREGVDACADALVIPVFSLRWQHVPSDLAIGRAVCNVAEYRPEPPPHLALTSEERIPESYLHRVWLEQLSIEIYSDLPVADLLHWLTQRFPEKNTHVTLAGFTRLVFASDMIAHFSENPFRHYETADGVLEGRPVTLKLA